MREISIEVPISKTNSTTLININFSLPSIIDDILMSPDTDLEFVCSELVAGLVEDIKSFRSARDKRISDFDALRPHLKIQEPDQFHLSPDGIAECERKFNAKHLGHWCIQTPDNSRWQETPVDVFYVANPDRSKGYSNYFGIYHRLGGTYICDASSAFSEPMSGLIDGHTVYVSRYRHDYVKTPSGATIDGGRDYCHTHTTETAYQVCQVTVVDGEFKFNLYEEPESNF